MQARCPAARAAARSARGKGARPRRVKAVAAQKKQYASFDEMLRTSGKPTLVDFYATWCGPCVLMANILNETAPELKESVQMVKIDTDKYPRIASQYRVEGLPTLVLFSADGRVLDRMEGVVQGPQLVERIRYFLAGEADKQEGAAAEGAV